MGNCVASLYSQGNQPLQMLGALFGMFGSGLQNFTNFANPAYADTVDTAYTSSCTDSDLNSAHIAADPFCNPIVGMPAADNMDLQTTWDAIEKITYADASGNTYPVTDQNDCANSTGNNTWDKVYGLCRGNTEVNQFLNDCITRNNNSAFSPMGSASNGVGTGSDCIIGGSDALPDLVVLYNYVQYFLANSNINQGSNLGQQADGSASS